MRDPIRELRRFMSGPFRTDVELPADARDTGFERDGQHVWLAPDTSYAYVGTPSGVEAWPRFDSGCA